MKLHDPKRPTVGHRPCYIPLGHIVIHSLQIWPLLSGQIEIRLMLPVKHNISKFFRYETTADELPSLVQQFADDPETFIKQLFMFDLENPDLNETPIEKSIEPPRPRLADLLGVL